MLRTLKNLLSPEARHRIVHSLPKPLRHRVVDTYISRQISAHKRSTYNDATWISGYWRTAREGGNAPIAYAQSTVNYDAEWLKAKVDQLLPQKGTVLEFGCNAGRILHRFAEDGYRSIGVEINPEAIALGKQTFPVLGSATFLVGDGPEQLRKVPVGSVDLSYSCAALMHVAPQKIGVVFDELGRIAPQYIITMEDEGSLSSRIFPHDYRTLLSAIGYTLRESVYPIDLRPYVEIGGLGMMFRVYCRS